MVFNDCFLDFEKVNKKLFSVPIDEKLRSLHYFAGGTFYDKEKRIIKNPAVKIVSIGGIPIKQNDKGELFLFGSPLNEENLNNALLSMAGMSSFLSYFNPGNKELDELGDKVVNNFKHKSVLHTFSLGILITGLSIGVEHEFSSQRDIIHLSRMTVARCDAQNSPLLVCPNEKLYPVYAEILKTTENIIKNNESLFENKEERNLLFPTAKASSLLITSSFNNVLKLISLKDKGGKEDELIRILMLLEKVVKKAFQEII